MDPIVDPRIERYVEAHSSRTTELLTRLERETRETMRSPQMLTGPAEGHFLRLLVSISGARRIVEVGTFTGYSALMMASALPEDGELITCEVNPEAEAVASRYFAESEDGHKIRIVMGPALETLSRLEGPFDLAFVDADKENYPRYYERLIELVRAGGLIAVDNALWSGEVLDPRDEEGRAIHRLNEVIRDDPRVDHVLVTIRDGIHLIQKRRETR